MKPAAIVSMLICGLIALTLTVWIGRDRAELPTTAQAKTPEERGPKIAETGPQPKAVFPETEFDFGSAERLSHGSHEFIVRNEGEAPLELVSNKDETSCQCTVGSVPGEKIPPGGQTTVKLEWHIRSPAPEFRHYAKIRTNDPQNKVVELVIKGAVKNSLQLKPEGEWAIGDLKIGEPTVATGTLFSPNFDAFEVTGFEATNPLVEATWEPLSPAQLVEHEAKSGYVVKVSIQPGAPVGTFKEKVTLKTSMENHPELTFIVSGKRPGPIDVLGVGWATDSSALLMGEFPADQGKAMTLSMFVREIDEDLRLVDVEKEGDAVEVTLEKDANFKSPTSQRYLMTVKVKPGPPGDHQRKNSEKIVLKLNHPKASEFKFAVDYLAR